MTRFDLISPRPRKDGKTFWVKIGAAFPRDKGGFSLVFDALPLPDTEGRVSLLMVEPTPREDRPPVEKPGSDVDNTPAGGGEPPFDSIPF